MSDASVTIGEFRCYPLADGENRYPKTAIFPGRSDEELAGFLTREELSSDLPVGYSALLIDTGKQRILIDTGAGPLGPATGRIRESLDRYGFSPDQIDLVILSHLHPDHIGGLLTPEGELSFPNAEFLVSKSEHDFWMSEGNQAKLKMGQLFGLGDIEQVILSWLQTYIPPLAAAGRLRTINSNCEASSGVALLPTFGHTPGHLAVLAANGNQQLLFGGDAFVHPAQIYYPDWNTVFETIPEAAVRTRHELLDRAAADHCLMFLFHFPFPCLGSLSRRNNGYEWEPLSLGL